jgi:hypothetical protein
MGAYKKMRIQTNRHKYIGMLMEGQTKMEFCYKAVKVDKDAR